jgi:hypothetical protein
MDPNNSGTWLMGFDDLLVDDPSDDDEGDMDVCLRSNSDLQSVYY